MSVEQWSERIRWPVLDIQYVVHSNAYFHTIKLFEGSQTTITVYLVNALLFLLLSCYRQSLTVDGEHHPIILNTHFSQKVLGETKQDNSVTCSKVLCPTEKTKPYPLTRCLWKRKENFKPSQVSIPNKQVCHLSFFTYMSISSKLVLSLLLKFESSSLTPILY